ncbi:hypothetical protein F383_06823 [Gossypium arboreum]|uniref:Uncharacterized protein n=1 Tax=Gossypium arboreum TaxID=29729 RepID=A0A0B0PDX3_GOSAR|nr:hypothetical protein F383_06823 [Gossypium arboreum]
MMPILDLANALVKLPNNKVCVVCAYVLCVLCTLGDYPNVEGHVPFGFVFCSVAIGFGIIKVEVIYTIKASILV